MGTLKAIFYAKDTVFISQHLLQPSIIASGVWLIRENMKVTEENHCSSSPLKVPIYATELVIIIFDDTHSFMINVLIRQALASVDFGTATFSHESCSFGVFSLPIIFFRCTVVFKNSYC